MNYKLINMDILRDERGKLVSIEGGVNIDFKRKNYRGDK